jgi:hypothetical protein
MAGWLASKLHIEEKKGARDNSIIQQHNHNASTLPHRLSPQGNSIRSLSGWWATKQYEQPEYSVLDTIDSGSAPDDIRDFD